MSLPQLADRSADVLGLHLEPMSGQLPLPMRTKIQAAQSAANGLSIGVLPVMRTLESFSKITSSRRVPLQSRALPT